MFLKADGDVLRDNYGQGDLVVLRGTNIGGWQLMESWMCPINSADQKIAITTLTERFGSEKAEELIKIYEENWITEHDFDLIEELNFNCLRLPISYLNLLDENGELREETLATYDWFIEECAKRDIYVILDLHGAPGSQSGRDHTGDTSQSILFTDKDSQEATIYIWEELAKHYKDNPAIAGYDLLNEPEGSETERVNWGEVQLPFLNTLYEAIRAIDEDHLIIMNAIWEPTNMPNPSEYGWENIMYQYHYYGWDSIDDPIAQRRFTDSKVDNDTRANHSVPVLIGEFTLFDKLQSWEYALDVYEENGWSWTTWTYKTVNRGSWGIYNSTEATTPTVDIYNDSEEVIKEKWSKTSTKDSFTQNKYLHDLLRVKADREAGENNIRKWFHNPSMTHEVNVEAGADAQVEMVNISETHVNTEDKEVIKLTVTGMGIAERESSRNVYIPPTGRGSVDASSMDYLVFNAYSARKNKEVTVTLVDNTGATWSDYTSSSAVMIPYSWEKIFIDISKAAVDISNIVEIRLGLSAPGTYYFDEIYFAQSYGDPVPDEVIPIVEVDKGKEVEKEISRIPKVAMGLSIAVGLLVAIGVFAYKNKNK